LGWRQGVGGWGAAQLNPPRSHNTQRPIAHVLVITKNTKSQKISVVVNLDDQTVFFLGHVVPIYDVDQTSINFGGRQMVDYGFSIRGHIDRASGRMEVTTVTLDPTKPDDPNIVTLCYDVGCTTNSVF
jgi:hypothetical protein